MSWKVLLLEDSRSVHELEQALRDIGCDVEAVTDRRMLASAKSIARLTAGPCDAVVLAVGGSRSSGLQLLDRIHKDARRRGVPIVIVGTDARALARHEASASPAEGYVRRTGDHDGLVQDLGAALLAVIGGGTRTAPPPPPDTPEMVETAGLLGVTQENVHTGMDLARDADTGERTIARVAVPADFRDAAVAPDALMRDVANDASASVVEGRPLSPPLAVVTSGATPSEPLPVANDLAMVMGRLEAMTRWLEEERAQYREALAAAALETEERLAEERAMSESALTAMASELHAQRVKLGQRVTEATTRAREADDRANAERSGATSALAAAEDALSARKLEIAELREAAARRSLAEEEELSRGRAVQSELAAQVEELRAAEGKLNAKLTAAASAFDRKQRELVETKEAAARSIVETKDSAARAIASDRADQEAAVKVASEVSEARLAEERARAAIALAAAEAAANTKYHELVDVLAAASKELEAKDAELHAAATAQDDAGARYEGMVAENNELQARLDAVTAESGQRLTELEGARGELAARQQQLDALARQSAGLEDDLGRSRAAVEGLEAKLASAGAEIRERTAREEGLERSNDELSSRAAALAASVDALEKAASAAEQRRVDEVRVLDEHLRLEKTARASLAADRTELRREVEAGRASFAAADEQRARENASHAEEVAERRSLLEAAEAVASAKDRELRAALVAAAGLEAANEALARVRSESAERAAQVERVEAERDASRAQHASDLEAAKAAIAEAEALRDGVVEELAGERVRGSSAVARLEAERDAARGDVAAVGSRIMALDAELARSKETAAEAQDRLRRESTLRRSDHNLALSALEAAESQIADLQGRKLTSPGLGAIPESGIRSIPSAGTPSRGVPASQAPASAAPPSQAPASRDAASTSVRPSSTRSPRIVTEPPPFKSGPRRSVTHASAEPDEDQPQPGARRAVLLIDGDRVARVNVVRALARANCEVSVRDSCADVASDLASHDAVVTDVSRVGIDELLRVCRDRRARPIFAWADDLGAAKKLFEQAGITPVAVFQKGPRPEALVAAVCALLDAEKTAPTGTSI